MQTRNPLDPRIWKGLTDPYKRLKESMTYGTSELSYNPLILKAFVELKLSTFTGLVTVYTLLTPCFIKD